MKTLRLLMSFGAALACLVAFGESPDAELPFVESDGSQYFDTGVLGKSFTKVELDFRYLAKPADGSYILGSCTKDSLQARVCPWYYSFGHGFFYGGEYCNSMGPDDIEKFCRYRNVIVLEPGVQTITWPDGLVYSTASSYNGTTSKNMYLFALNNGGTTVMSGVKARLYSLKIWQKSSASASYGLLRDYRPARKGSKVGLFDAVNKKMYYPKNASGAETTIYGPRSDPWHVYSYTTGGLTPCQQLTNAVTQVGRGDTILIHKGTYKFAADMYMLNYVVKKNSCKFRLNLTQDDVTIMGEDTSSRKGWTSGSEPVILDGNGGKILQMQVGKTGSGLVKNITFANGSGGSAASTDWAGGAIGIGEPSKGGGIHVVITNCIFRGNTARYGGAVALVPESTDPKNFSYCVYDSLFTNNTTQSTASTSKGGCMYYGNAYGCDFIGNDSCGASVREVVGCRFIGNAGGKYGMHVLTESETVRDCLFLDNELQTTKNEALVGACRLLENCHFTNNALQKYRGVVTCRGKYLTDGSVDHFATVTNCTFHGNQNGTTKSGLATVTDAGTVVGCRFTSNTGYAPGGLSVTATDARTFVKDTYFGGNSCEEGGAVNLSLSYKDVAAADLAEPVFTFDNCTFETNFGAAYTKGGTATGGAVLNLASDLPAGVELNSLVVCTNGCRFVRNRGVTAGVAAVTARDCTFLDNCSTGGFDAPGDAAGSRLECCELSGGNLQACSLDRCRIHHVTNMCVFNVGCSVTNTLVTDCVISDGALVGRSEANAAQNGGQFVNCTFARNFGDFFAGITNADDVSFWNCGFFWNTNGNNVATSLSWDDASEAAGLLRRTVRFDHCAYGPLAGKGPDPGSDDGNFLCPIPKFNETYDPDRPYFEPRYGSPLREAGENSMGFMPGDLDLGGNERVNGIIDIGAYECWAKAMGLFIIVR